MAGVSIGRLSLHISAPAMPSEVLVHKITNGLVQARLSRYYPRNCCALELWLAGRPNESDEALANRIVAGLIRQLDLIS